MTKRDLRPTRAGIVLASIIVAAGAAAWHSAQGSARALTDAQAASENAILQLRKLSELQAELTRARRASLASTDPQPKAAATHPAPRAATPRPRAAQPRVTTSSNRPRAKEPIPDLGLEGTGNDPLEGL